MNVLKIVRLLRTRREANYLSMRSYVHSIGWRVALESVSTTAIVWLSCTSRTVPVYSLSSACCGAGAAT